MSNENQLQTGSRRTQEELLAQVEAHFRRELPRLDVGLVRGQPYAPYLCPAVGPSTAKVSIIFMSYGYSHRAQLLLQSLDRQEGVGRQQVEIVTVTDATIETSNRFDHRVLHIEPSIHKAKHLNAAAEVASGDILLFTDADALFPPYFLASLLTTVQTPKLHISVRKDLAIPLVERLIADPSLLEYLDYQGLRDALPNRWPFDWIMHTPSGFMHVLPRALFFEARMYDVSFTDFGGYDWEFCNRVFALTGQPILVPDMWAIHMDHPRDYTGGQIRSGQVAL